MFFNGNVFWFIMGVIGVLVGLGFKAFAEDRGWVLNWWKWLLSIIWYSFFSLSILAWGTLIGENEAGAGFRMFLFGLVVCLILGVGLWRLLAANAKDS